jgi:hypothetical protein
MTLTAVKRYKIGGALTALMNSQMNHEKNGNIKMCNTHHEEQAFRNKKLDN